MNEPPRRHDRQETQKYKNDIKNNGIHETDIGWCESFEWSFLAGLGGYRFDMRKIRGRRRI